MNLNDFKREYLKGVRCPPVNNINLRDGGVKHKLLVIEVCKRLVERGLPFFTEVELRSYGRADVVSPLAGEVIEVTVSESDKRYKEKVKLYLEKNGLLRVVRINTINDVALWNKEHLEDEE